MRKFRSNSFRAIRSRYSSYKKNTYTPMGSDDGYDAAKDAYLTGEGPAVTYSQRMEEEALREEYRRDRYERGEY